jgi:nucleotide-binding universal stress UspA family protein
MNDRKLSIDLVHIFDIPITMSSSQFPRAVEGLITERGDALRQKLTSWRDQIPGKQTGELHIIYGVYPSTEIVELATRINADLIVMGLRQKYSMVDRLIGTVTANTISKSTIPVLAIPQGAIFQPIRNIIFPTIMGIDDQLSQAEEEALFKLIEFANFSGGTKVNFVHIQTDSDDEQARIDIIFNDVPFKGIEYTRSYAPHVDEGVLKFLEDGKADLLAFYKPHRSFWERLYHSSLTRKLLFKSRTPLLIFH